MGDSLTVEHGAVIETSEESGDVVQSGWVDEQSALSGQSTGLERGGDGAGFVIQLGVAEGGFDGVGIGEEGQDDPLGGLVSPVAKEFNQSGATRDRWLCLLGNHRGYLR